MQDNRDPQRPCRQTAGSGNIAAHAQHHVRLKTLHNRSRLTPGVENTHRRQHLRLQALAAQAGYLNEINFNAVLRH